MRKRNTYTTQELRKIELFYEIVQILDDASLIDASGARHCLAAPRDVPLQPGFYIVVWPRTARSHQYDQSARYFGPMTTRDDAKMVLELSVRRYYKGRAYPALH